MNIENWFVICRFGKKKYQGVNGEFIRLDHFDKCIFPSAEIFFKK